MSVTKKFSDLSICTQHKKFVGDKIRLAKILNTEIIVHSFEITDSKYPKKGNDKCLCLQISIDGKKYISFSIAKILMDTIQKVPIDAFPFSTKIINDNDYYEFT